jgi:hypothetical protein
VGNPLVLPHISWMINRVNRQPDYMPNPVGTLSEAQQYHQEKQ